MVAALALVATVEVFDLNSTRPIWPMLLMIVPPQVATYVTVRTFARMAMRRASRARKV